MRYYLASVVLFVLSVPANAQIKVEGPNKATVGYRVKAKLTTDVADFKLKCFPGNDDWVGIIDFEGNKWIDFVPGKNILGNPLAAGTNVAPKLFTFVAAGNKAGKTYLETWEVTVYPDGDSPTPGPGPTPAPDSQLMKDLKAAYMVNPSPLNKNKLITVYSKLVTDSAQMTSFKQAADQLSKETPLAIGSDLQPVRDVVAEYLVANVGRQGSAWNQATLVAALRQIITCLQAL
jgi:hypothetical protein